ncbi:class I adenylate-forming enzyme family protein [Rhodobaculum claviforme]|uniref:Long-chain fatty acid--CoA ligase n=1 Tax=Rhodobaculum claviforme TaxID=1549854 RepID=A0A934WIE2_9RHOB|nr:AMP-binding protein [Rhodobaculum claviforme]MBK5926746.1 long-chain fatty acid--CoA ligase [Rhodobaculum claviforme]
MQPIRVFERAVRRWPDAIAVECGARTLSYRALAARVGALAAGLQAIDPAPGSRVAICCGNDLAHLTAWLAVLAAGKVWVPLYPRNPQDELARAAAFTRASIVITTPELRDALAIDGARVIVAEGTGPDTVAGLIAAHDGGAPVAHRLAGDATQAIKFTGGTTGRPKGVMQPYRAWNTNIVTQIAAWGLAPGDRYLAGAPITHGTSTYILPTLATGGTLVLMDRPTTEQTLDALRNAAITTTFLPPTVLYMLMQQPGVAGDYPHLRTIVYGAGPMRPEEIARAQSIFGPVIGSTYGQTEAPQIATMISAAEMLRDDKRASVGRETMLSEVAVLDPDGRAVPPGETGEIVIAGDLVMTGYWDQPDVTAKTLRGGWLHTGDLGFIDDEGFVFIRGRAKDMIITGGFNVYPADVEPAIGAHPAVADCAVFGVPDDKWGEAVHAAVQLRPGHAAGDGLARDIIGFVRDRAGPVRTPKTVTFYDAMPRNQIGKLQKDVLVADFTARATTEG